MNTQCERILKHYREGGKPLTDVSARNLYSIGRLASRVGDLRKDGYSIDTVWVEGQNKYGEKTRFASYVFPIGFEEE